MPPYISYRPLVLYTLTLIFIGFYGARVCPFIDSLSVSQIINPLLVIFLIQLAVRHSGFNRFILRQKLERQVNLGFYWDYFLFLFAGLSLTIFNMAYHDFPFGSGLKVFVSFASLGFFVSVELALDHERRLVDHLSTNNISLQAPNTYFPLVGKFSIFASVAVLFIVGSFFLLVNKDLDWLLDPENQISLVDGKQSILKEFFYVGFALLGFVLAIIFSYAKNLRIFFNHEKEVLKFAVSGDLSRRVIVGTHDEFGEIAHQTNEMIQALKLRNEELQYTQNVTIMTLASVAETRDNETGAHIVRTQNYVRVLAEYLREQADFSQELTEDVVNLLYLSAPLHDIGKVGIPDAILLKPGKLTPEEFEIMKQHAKLGGDAITRALGDKAETSFLRYAREIASSHHEKWDGSGYPLGLMGDDIPLSGRLMAVADVYDALISKRVYKKAFTHQDAAEIIREGRGKHFDPRIVDAFDALENEFMKIASEFAD